MAGSEASQSAVPDSPARARHLGPPAAGSRPAPQAPVRFPLIELFHPIPVLLTVLGAAAFAVIAVHGHPQPALLGRIVAVTLLSQVAVAVYNDLRDHDLDLVACPWRAIPSGVVSPATAATVAALMAAGAVLIALTLGPLSAGLVGLGTALGLAYSRWFKTSVLSWLPFALAFPLLPIWVLLVSRVATANLWTVAIIGAPIAVAIHLADAAPDRHTDATHGSAGLATRLTARQMERWPVSLLGIGVAGALAMAWLTPHPVVAVGAAVLASGLLVATSVVGAVPSRLLLPGFALILASGWILAVTN